MTRYFISIRQFDNSVRPFCSGANCFLRGKNLHSKTLRLHYGAAGQVAATEPGRKSQIVLDTGAHSRLAAGRFPLNDYGVQTFRGAINGGGQTSRTSSHNGQVVEAGLGARPQPNFLCDVGRYTFKKFRSVGEKHHRETGRLWAQSFEQAFGLRIIDGSFDVDPLIRNVVASQEVAQLVASRRPAGS